jgi:hypothetical protein
MLISCGTALFGLRLAVRSLGYLPVVELLPDPARRRLLARVTLGRAEPITPLERKLLEALPHRHTHRGPWDAGPLPTGLLAGLQHDALAEGAQLALVDRALAYHKLADLARAAGHGQDRDPVAREEMRRGAGARPNPHPTASPPTPSPPGLITSPGGYRSVTSTSAAAWGCCPAAGRRPPPPRSCSPPATAALSGCAPARRCTGCWHTQPPDGCSPACTPSRWNSRRSGP